MSFIINPFLQDRNVIVSVENPRALTVHNGTVAGSLVFQSTIQAKVAGGFYRSIPVNYDTTGYNGSVDGSYTLTGTLAPTGLVTNPFTLTVSIVVWVIPVPHVHIDYVDKARITGGIDNIGRMTTAVTGKAGINLAQKNANLIQRPSWNGEGVYNNTQSAMLQSGASSVFTRYSNGGQFTWYFVFKQLAVGTTHFGPLIDSINASSANTGIGLYIDNRIAVPRTNAVVLFITRSAAPAAITLVSSDNAIVQNAWNCVKVTYDGTTVRCSTSANGGAFTEVGTATAAAAFSASNPANLLTFGNLFTIGASTGCRAYRKHDYMEDSFMSAGDRTFLDGWAQAMCLENLQVTEANVYIRTGQSNEAGRGLNTGIAPELADRVGAYIMVPSPTPATNTPGSGSITSDSYWSECQLGVNQTTEFVTTRHGAEMRFGYEMHQYNENCFMIKYGVGGTPIFEQATYNNWNVTTPTLYTQLYGLTVTGLDEIEHVFRKTPIIRGLSVMQGETDALSDAAMVGAGAAYKANWTTFINQLIDDIVAFGYPVTKMRIFFWQISDAGGFAYDATNFPLVKAAQVDLGTNYLTDNPSRTVNVKGVTTRTTDDLSFIDTQHYDDNGQDARGLHEFNYYKIWVSE